MRFPAIVIPSAVEGSRCPSLDEYSGFFDSAEFTLSERSESNGLRSE